MKYFLIAILLPFIFLTCKKQDAAPATPAIAGINCTAATISTIVTAGVSFTGTISVPYSGGNGANYSIGTLIPSTGVTGLQAILQGGTLANGAGSFTYTVTGLPATNGTAFFDIPFGNSSCRVSVPVNEAPLVQYGIPFSGVPDPSDAIIYQINMRAFSATRNFQGVINRLDSIKALGVNVIYLLPTYPIGTLNAINSLYCIKDYKGVNAEFGTLADLRNLIDAAHSRGMAVILDWVANHTAWDHPWITAHKDWYVQNANGVIQSPVLGWTDVAQLNFSSSAMRKEMIQAMKYWVYTVNCDGFRCDYADGPPTDFWRAATDSLRTISSHKLLLLAESNNTSNYAAGFDFIFGFNFYGTLKSVFATGSSVLNINNLNNTDYAGVINPQQQVVRYLTNHDVNSSDGPVVNLFGGSAGSMAAFVTAAYMRSVPMLYNGQEVGTNYPLFVITYGNTVTWNQNQNMVEEYKRIIAFRKASPAIKRGALTNYSTTDICAFTKEAGSEKVIVISNLRNTAIDYTIPSSLVNTNWTNAMTGSTFFLGTQLSIQPYGYLILKN